jgi:hypothetical protein
MTIQALFLVVPTTATITTTASSFNSLPFQILLQRHSLLLFLLLLLLYTHDKETVSKAEDMYGQRYIGY